MRRPLCRVAGWFVGFAALVLRLSCRLRYHNDPRPRLTAGGWSQIVAALHANQIAGALAADRGSAVMASRSVDGEIIVPALRICGMFPIRGSSGTRKGGATALQRLIQYVHNGHTAVLTCDGPRGPRGSVQKGIGLLAKKTDSVVLPVIAIPTGRWILTKTWDRLQIPKPFSTIDIYFGRPLFPLPNESLAQFAGRVQVDLNQLEAEHDPAEATLVTPQAIVPESRRAA